MSASVHVGIPPPPQEGGTPPKKEEPPTKKEEPPQEGDPPKKQTVNERPVRFLLECILVCAFLTEDELHFLVLFNLTPLNNVRCQRRILIKQKKV